jgi:hypothetical protein
VTAPAGPRSRSGADAGSRVARSRLLQGSALGRVRKPNDSRAEVRFRRKPEAPDLSAGLPLSADTRRSDSAREKGDVRPEATLTRRPEAAPLQALIRYDRRGYDPERAASFLATFQLSAIGVVAAVNWALALASRRAMRHWGRSGLLTAPATLRSARYAIWPRVCALRPKTARSLSDSGSRSRSNRR